jgi:hypothetical protein
MGRIMAEGQLAQKVTKLPPSYMKSISREIMVYVRSLAFLGQMEVPKASTKTRPPDL